MRINPKTFFTLILAIFLCLCPPCLSSDIQSECEKILGENPGAIIVFNLQNSKPVAVVNPETAFRRSFKPGSIFKLVTAAALLEKSNVDPDEKINCRNFFSYMGQNYICSIPGGHGPVNLTLALAQSCSVYFYRQSFRLDPEQLRDTAYAMGLGRSIKPPKIPYEPIPGKVNPPVGRRRFIRFAVGDDEGIKITPWQALNLAAVVCTGNFISESAEKPAIKEETREILTRAMEMAVGAGTCKPLSKAGIDAAAKTGTSTHPHFPAKYRGWFIACAPSRQCKYAVVVFLEDGKGYTDAVNMGVKVLRLLSGNDE